MYKIINKCKEMIVQSMILIGLFKRVYQSNKLPLGGGEWHEQDRFN